MARARVHELANELDVSCDDILDFLDDVGVKARDRSTVLAESVQGRIRGRFAPGRHTQARHHRTRPAQSADPRPDRVTPTHSSAPPPLLPAADPGAGVLFLAPGSTPAVQPDPMISSTTPEPSVPGPRTPDRPTGSPTRHTPVIPSQRRPPDEPDPIQEAAALAGWIRRDFSEEEFLRWKSAGLAIDESALADQCRIAGIEPDQLALVLSGRSALQRLRGGEGATSVWARIAEGEQYRSRGQRLGGRFALS